jgi:Cu2+-exporting ATPase
LSELKTGDVLLVRPGAGVPADGEVIDGRSAVNESIITGESRPVDKATGDKVIGGTINGQGALRVKVTLLGEDSALGQIMRIVDEAQQSRTHAQDLADRAAFLLTIAALVAGTVTLVVWLAVGESTSYAIQRMVTVLVISCPHALGLAIPLVVAISTAVSARSGMLVRNRLALENSRNLTRVVFDKTGTLTKGELGVVELEPLGELQPQRALALAAAVERDSEHPIAVAIRNRAQQDGVEIPDVHDFASIAGQGVRAQVDGHAVAVGGPRMLEAVDVQPSSDARERAERWGGEGKSVIYLLADGKPAAMFGLADVVRDESRAAVADLKELGISVTMLTGDSRDVASWVAKELGIDDVRAQVLPGDKADNVASLKGPGQVVAMVGDGVNDAPALVTADVGIAIGAGTDVAIDSADIVLVKSDPRDVAKVVRLSRSVYRKMLQNLGWAAGYNVIAVPLAAGVLAPIGIVLVPALGAVLMSLSTIIVALNAQLLRRVRLGD